MNILGSYSKTTFYNHPTFPTRLSGMMLNDPLWKNSNDICLRFARSSGSEWEAAVFAGWIGKFGLEQRLFVWHERMAEMRVKWFLSQSVFWKYITLASFFIMKNVNHRQMSCWQQDVSQLLQLHEKKKHCVLWRTPVCIIGVFTQSESCRNEWD